MKKRIKYVNERGITLIALVITIIVLLILAAVSISTLAGQNGILSRANDAKEQTEISSVKEQAQLDITNWITEELKNGREGSIDNWEDVKTILDTANPDTENRYYKNVTEEGVETPNGYIVPIEELYSSNSGEGETSKTIEDLKIGDRVNYVDKNNVTRECIVLYDSSSEYGVQIITKDVVEDTVTLGADDDFDESRNSYNSILKTLHDEAQKYLNLTYANGARCVGSNPADPDWDTTTNEAGYYTKEIAEEQNKYYSYMNSYYGTLKNGDENYNIDLVQMGTITNVDIKAASNKYYLASRVSLYNSGNSLFCVRSVNTSGSLNTNTLCSVYSSGRTYAYSCSFGFRPVFTLKPGIKVTRGEDNTPYTLVVE